MTRIPRVCLVPTVLALLALLVVPMAGARPLSFPSIQAVNGGWLDAAESWLQDLSGLRLRSHHGASQGKPPVHTKEDANLMRPNNGSCINPLGHPMPCP